MTISKLFFQNSLKSTTVLISFLVLLAFCAGGCSESTGPAVDTILNQGSTDPKVELRDPKSQSRVKKLQAEHQFFRDVALTDVTKNMPEGSVDRIYIDGQANPFVIVVTTVKTNLKEGESMTSTFTNAEGSSIKIRWDIKDLPADGPFVGLFVIPADMETGTTALD